MWKRLLTPPHPNHKAVLFVNDACTVWKIIFSEFQKIITILKNITALQHSIGPEKWLSVASPFPNYPKNCISRKKSSKSDFRIPHLLFSDSTISYPLVKPMKFVWKFHSENCNFRINFPLLYQDWHRAYLFNRIQKAWTRWNPSNSNVGNLIRNSFFGSREWRNLLPKI